MKMTITMMVIGGLAVAGFAYFIRNPEKLKIVKNMGEDAMDNINKLSE